MKTAIITIIATVATTAGAMTKDQAIAELKDNASRAIQSAAEMEKMAKSKADRKWAAKLRNEAAEAEAMAAAMTDEIAAAMTEVEAANDAFKTLNANDRAALEAAIKRQTKANRRMAKLAKQATHGKAKNSRHTKANRHTAKNNTAKQ